MKQLNRILRFLGIFFALAAAGGAVSCSDLIYDDEEDCTQIYRITFNYDMNMKFANAFPAECNSVTLYVFDNNGKYLKTYTTTVEELKNTDYYLTLDLEPGSYKFIAWCGLDEENQSFSVPTLTAGVSTYSELTNTIKRSNASVGEIDNLYYGTLDATLPDEVGVFDYEIHLLKNTNRIHIVLQMLTDAGAITEDSYNFYLTSENGYMNWDNSLHTDEVLTYNCYNKFTATADATVNGVEHQNVQAIGAEISTGRLVKDWNTKTMLVVEKADGSELLKIDFIEYALLVKGKYNEDMSDQEFLDRLDDYNFVFFIIDNGTRWMRSEIMINSWRVVLQDQGLGN